MGASQLRYPEIELSGAKYKFFIFLRAEGKRNALKHNQTSFRVQWSRMGASQLWYPEIVHLGTKYKFCIFLHAEGYEMLWTLPNIILGLME
jgi:hypothetical protein